MPSEGEADAETEIPRRSGSGVLGASLPQRGPSESLLAPLSSPRGSRSSRALIAVLAALVLALIGYELFVAPKDDDVAWTPPAGLSTEQTPPWLQTLCANRTPELCAAANRARNPDDCASLRAALGSLQALERKLSARGAITARQHWVLVELYGQGHELCQFVHGTQPASAK